MIKFIVIFFSLFFLYNCSFNVKYNYIVHSTKKNNTLDDTISSLDNEKLLSAKQIIYLKNLIKNDPKLISLLTPNQVLNLLGHPLIIKKQPVVEIWQYRNKCILNIVWEKNDSKDYLKKFLYNTPGNLKNNKIDFKIVWMESISVNQSNLTPEACFFKLAHIKT